MDAIALDGSGDIDQIFIEHGHQGNVVHGREVAKDLIERADVVGSVIGRQRDSGQEDLYVRTLERGENLIEIGARLVDRQAAQSVVAAKLDNHDGGVKAQYIGEACERILGSGAACALVDDLVRVATRIEQLLKSGGIGLVFIEAQSGGNAVTEADENWPVGIGQTGGRERPGRQQRETKCDENYAPNVHVLSVDARNKPGRARVRRAEAAMTGHVHFE